MNIYDLKVMKRNGEEYDLSALKGKVTLVVNTATGCGFTPQYEGLEALYEKYHEQGFEILDFPCDQFGHQAPGTDDEIHAFCTSKYDTKFDQMSKIEVNGENQSEVYKILKQQQPEEEVKGVKNKAAMKMIAKLSTTCKEKGDIVWNFTKFLVDKEGNAVRRYDPTCIPVDIEEDLLALL